MSSHEFYVFHLSHKGRGEKHKIHEGLSGVGKAKRARQI
jgi:hypothetical protein